MYAYYDVVLISSDDSSDDVYAIDVQLIGRAIETLLYGTKGKKNVLMFGYGKVRVFVDI